ncbi:MAG: Ltp family lipoprotein [Patescibacteria group bacterium]
MKKCKACQTEIDSKATKCPHCQTDQRSWFRKHPILTIILGLFVLSLTGSAGKGGSSSTATPTAPAKTAETASNPVATVQPTAISENKQANVPAEYKSALNKATSYANTMHMSKRGVYDQLVSDFGEKFSAEAAQYAIDNVKADWNANALAKAETYQSTMNMSPSAIHNQLTSDAGEKFTQAEADYAIQHLSK